ncbi:DUF4184 family protein [Blastococcus sp. LR1]|uniref:DUF4184 family protein n=1 Tax=Blastococcus sp. LR1 TaxID=2877000 RepID=UPI001CC9FE28|nr:DUF4184 family protein [Blastococcus sp. LR1]MCA0145941.1 DUF4184 family protein [Blastococcus sp. LR1]
MPFSGSHPAAVLPFLRTPPSASALVAGSLAPDIPYYVPLDLPWRTHTALAVVTTDVVLGLRARLAPVRVGLRARLRSARAVLLVLAAVGTVR